MFIADGTHILTNVVIVDSIHANLVLRVVFFGVSTMIIVQAKITSYYNRHLENDLILLVVEIFRCLHQQTNDFVHRYANIVATLAFGLRRRQQGCKVAGLDIDPGVTSHAPGSAKSPESVRE